MTTVVSSGSQRISTEHSVEVRDGPARLKGTARVRSFSLRGLECP